MPFVLFVVDGKLSRLSGFWVLTQIRLDRQMAWHEPLEGCHGAVTGPRPMAKGIRGDWHARMLAPYATSGVRSTSAAPSAIASNRRGGLMRKRWGSRLLRLPGATLAMHRSYPTFSTKSRRARRSAASRESCQRMRHRFEHRCRRLSLRAVAGLRLGRETLPTSSIGGP